MVRVEMGRYLADRIPGAKFVELDGADHLFFTGDADTLLDEIEEFLTGVRPLPAVERVLATVLFTDVVDSTKRAVELGDERWKELLGRHDARVRRQLERFHGHEVNKTGDGFLARFDGSARAIRCATGIRDVLRGLGLEVRAGVHTGEVELRDDDISGVAVHAVGGPRDVLHRKVPPGVVADRIDCDPVAQADRDDYRDPSGHRRTRARSADTPDASTPPRV